MLSSTLSEALKSYRIGERLRALRTERRLGLVELGNHTGLSPALLSKIERGRLFPTLPTLMRIAMVFNVGLGYFFDEERRRPAVAIVRAAERLEFPDFPNGKPPAYTFECLDYAATERKFNCYLARFRPSPPGRARGHRHPGAEFIYVMCGRLGLSIGDQEHVLDAGDAVYFDASVAHHYRRIGRQACRALVVTLGQSEAAVAARGAPRK